MMVLVELAPLIVIFPFRSRSPVALASSLAPGIVSVNVPAGTMIVLEPSVGVGGHDGRPQRDVSRRILAVMEVDCHRIERGVDPEGRKLQPLLQCLKRRVRSRGPALALLVARLRR